LQLSPSAGHGGEGRGGPEALLLRPSVSKSLSPAVFWCNIVWPSEQPSGELPWREVTGGVVAEGSSPNKYQVRLLCWICVSRAVQLLLADRGGEGKVGTAAAVSCSSRRWSPRHHSSGSRDSLLLSAGYGGEGEAEFASGLTDGEGRRGREVVLVLLSRHQPVSVKLKLRKFPSDGEERRRYLWPRGPLRTSRVVAPRIFLLQAELPTRRSIDLNTAIHPDGGPSGVVPGVAASGRVARSWNRLGGDE